MKFSFYTLGCKVNQYETQAMEQLLQAQGHTIGTIDDACDGYIINTCTVTAVADKKNRAVIRRIRRQAPAAVVGVCGCYAQVSPEAIRALGVDVISGSAGREAFLEMMIRTVADRKNREAVDQAMRRRQFEILPAGSLESRTRAMLKVQDGCCNFCTYCIIPYARGPVRSLPLEEAVAQAEVLAGRGYREIVVTGIEVASWGMERRDGSTVTDLLDAVCRAVPQVRIRLGSMEPRAVDDRFCETLKTYGNLCPQFHLSMQSGCDSVLCRMGRKYTTDRYLESVERLRRAFPGCAITTDMIVGFPGETEEEFAQSLAFIQRCAFASMHIFPYSRRPGTPAARMEDQLSNQVKEMRSTAAIAVAQEMNLAFRQRMLGSVQEVLFEEPSGSYFTGHAPNSIRVYAPGKALHNQLRRVRVMELYQDGVLGEILP